MFQRAEAFVKNIDSQALFRSTEVEPARMNTEMNT